MKKLQYSTNRSNKIWTDYYSRNDIQTRFIRFLDNNYFSHAFKHEMHKVLPKKGKMLEAGCGESVISARLAKQGYDVTFLDISKQALMQAKVNLEKVAGRSKNIKVKYVKGDIFKLPFKKDSFEVVWNQGVLEHFTQPEKAIAEMYRVTKQGGHVAILVPYIYSPLHLYDILLRRFHQEKFWPFEEQIFYTKKLIATQLQRATKEQAVVKLIPFALGFSIIGYVTKTKTK